MKIIIPAVLCLCLCSGISAAEALNPKTVEMVESLAAKQASKNHQAMLRILDDLETLRIATELCKLDNDDFLVSIRLIIKYVDTSKDLEFLGDTLTVDELKKRDQFVDILKSATVKRKLDSMKLGR